ncbi:EF-hand domain-containing protein [Lysobacter fragariae]
MKSVPRNSLIGALALVASLSAPLAFAQSESSTASDPAQQSTSATDASSATTADAQYQSTTSNDASAAATAGDPAKKSWNDVDGDKDGKLSKTEAAAVPALGQVFDQADADADGTLTADEYKAYVAKAQGGDKPAEDKK